MADITVPTLPIVSSSFGLQFNTQTFTSPLSGVTQTKELTGAKWGASYNLSPMKQSSAKNIQAFLLKLRGGVNTFQAYDPDHKSPSGTANSSPGTPKVAGGSQTGNTLDIDGCPTSETGWLLVGDYFTVNNEFKMITEDVDTNGSGEATLTFEPPLRNSPSDNADVEVSSPTCKMMLVDDNQSGWDSNQFGVYSFQINAIEKIE